MQRAILALYLLKEGANLHFVRNIGLNIAHLSPRSLKALHMADLARCRIVLFVRGQKVLPFFFRRQRATTDEDERWVDLPGQILGQGQADPASTSENQVYSLFPQAYRRMDGLLPKLDRDDFFRPAIGATVGNDLFARAGTTLKNDLPGLLLLLCLCPRPDDVKIPAGDSG